MKRSNLNRLRGVLIRFMDSKGRRVENLESSKFLRFKWIFTFLHKLMAKSQLFNKLELKSHNLHHLHHLQNISQLHHLHKLSPLVQTYQLQQLNRSQRLPGRIAYLKFFMSSSIRPPKRQKIVGNIFLQKLTELATSL